MINTINEAIVILKAGGILLYPTDTVWGLGCDATNAEAVAKISALKQRAESKNYVVLLHTANELERYVRTVPDVAWDMVDFAENPLTIIYPNSYMLANNVIADDKTVGIRIIKEGFAHELIKRYRKPIVSTSANISGSPSPKTFAEIEEAIIKGVDLVIPQQYDTGNGQPSTIMKIEESGRFEFIRR